MSMLTSWWFLWMTVGMRMIYNKIYCLISKLTININIYFWKLIKWIPDDFVSSVFGVRRLFLVSIDELVGLLLWIFDNVSFKRLICKPIFK